MATARKGNQLDRRLLVVASLVVLLVLATVLFVHRAERFSAADPDRYFHVAVSRMEATGGLVRALPQADDIGWAEGFPEKEFLFHVLTTLGYRLGGERGVLLVVPVLASAAVMALFLACCGVAGEGAALLLCVSFTFLFPHFFIRLQYLRPQLLAVLLFILLLAGAARRWTWLVFTASTLYALAYHAIYMPLAVAGCAFALELVAAKRKWFRVFAAGSFGVIAGTLLNPYFPRSVQMMFTQLGGAGDSELNHLLDAGVELFPLPALEYLQLYLVPWAAALGAGALVYRGRARFAREPRLQAVLFLAVLEATFLVLTAISPRATEYATPCCALLLAHAWPVLEPGRKQVIGALVLFLALQSTALRTLYRPVLAPPSEPPQAALALRALGALPPEAAGKKVFHCEWWLGSYVLYARPDMRFVDLLAPHFLFERALRKSIERMRLDHGLVADPYPLIAREFGARYVLCANRGVVSQLRRDRRFGQLFPAQGDSASWPGAGPFLFEVY